MMTNERLSFVCIRASQIRKGNFVSRLYAFIRINK